ncbi:MAG: YIP1 family protein [Paenirhodobacter sp.]|uniref:YIP1 family protein n=1 Tax=Paenirhodobacter sp. TaxID=1965326 RepID=UPI003D14818A
MERLLVDLVWRSLREPRSVARWLIATAPSREARLLGLLIVMALSATFGLLAEMLFSFVTKIDLGDLGSPFAMAALQGAIILYTAFAMTVFGRQFGGKGRFEDALLLAVWIEFVLIVGQGAQILIMVFFPLVSTLGTLALFALMFWLLVQFTAALHGFTNIPAVWGGVIAVFFGSALVLGAVMLSLGITPPFVVAQ